ncbi:methylated-DNA--protein-cysteine methyltransferase [Naviculisporaceae sp. PSN 640]
MDPQTAAQTLASLIAQSTSPKTTTTNDNTNTNTNTRPNLNRLNITPQDKKVYTLLLQIPPGSFTTYAILAKLLNSSPRAIGNSCRRNPFAPTVPCHRVVATDRALGGFKGEHISKVKIKSKITTSKRSDVQLITTSVKTKQALLTLDEKRKLLKNEGVKFDVKGEKVLGTPFAGFRI